MRIFAYDYILERDVEFESLVDHCDSCIDDFDAGYSFSSGCCCIHQREYSSQI